MSEVMGEGLAYGDGDPEKLGYEYLIDRARSGTVVVLLPSTGEQGEAALACTTSVSSPKTTSSSWWTPTPPCGQPAWCIWPATHTPTAGTRVVGRATALPSRDERHRGPCVRRAVGLSAVECSRDQRDRDDGDAAAERKPCIDGRRERMETPRTRARRSRPGRGRTDSECSREPSFSQRNLPLRCAPGSRTYVFRRGGLAAVIRRLNPSCARCASCGGYTGRAQVASAPGLISNAGAA